MFLIRSVKQKVEITDNIYIYLAKPKSDSNNDDNDDDRFRCIDAQ